MWQLWTTINCNGPNHLRGTFHSSAVIEKQLHETAEISAESIASGGGANLRSHSGAAMEGGERR